MRRYVVDASVVAKWFLPEAHSDEALRVIATSADLHAPDLVIAEVGNALWKWTSRGAMKGEEAGRVARDLLRIPIRLHSSRDLIEGALHLASRIGRTVYDALYVTLAAALDCPVVTADRKLIDALVSHGIGARALWVGDVPTD